MPIKVKVTAPYGVTLRPPVKIVDPTKEQLVHRGHLLTEAPEGSGVYEINHAVSFKCGEVITIEGSPGSGVLTDIADAVTGDTGPALRPAVKKFTPEAATGKKGLVGKIVDKAKDLAGK